MNTTNTIIIAVALVAVAGVVAWALTRPAPAPMAPSAPAPAAAPASRTARRSGVERGIETLTDLVRTGASIYTSIDGSSPSKLGAAGGGK